MTLYVVWVRRTPESEAVAPHVGHDANRAHAEAVAWANQGHHRVWIEAATETNSTDILGLGIYRGGQRVSAETMASVADAEIVEFRDGEPVRP